MDPLSTNVNMDRLQEPEQSPQRKRLARMRQRSTPPLSAQTGQNLDGKMAAEYPALYGYSEKLAGGVWDSIKGGLGQATGGLLGTAAPKQPATGPATKQNLATNLAVGGNLASHGAAARAGQSMLGGMGSGMARNQPQQPQQPLQGGQLGQLPEYQTPPLPQPQDMTQQIAHPQMDIQPPNIAPPAQQSLQDTTVPANSMLENPMGDPAEQEQLDGQELFAAHDAATGRTRRPPPPQASPPGAPTGSIGGIPTAQYRLMSPADRKAHSDRRLALGKQSAALLECAAAVMRPPRIH